MDTPQVEFLRATWFVFGTVGLFGVAVAFGAFLVVRHLSNKWLDAKFSERLENYKHAQQIEIENTKLKINNLFDRNVRIHIKEYEYLPNIWAGLNEAYRSAQSMLGGVRQYPNLYSVSNEDLEKILDISGLEIYEKEKIRGSSNKMKAWIEI
ncbi:hypothetical protein ACQKJ1_28205 [Methylorubrum rhodesianum]|uniref:hypothetical protein n=1 Tax=Methylorubrum rhodesianum TaxID=29427 RepID=UPI003D09382A